MTAVNDAPGSFQPNRSGKIRRWAEDEIGRNSVRPCRIPRKTAWNQSVIGGSSARDAGLLQRVHGRAENLGAAVAGPLVVHREVDRGDARGGVLPDPLGDAVDRPEQADALQELQGQGAL